MTHGVQSGEWRRYGFGGPPEPWPHGAQRDLDRLATSYYLEILESRSEVAKSHPSDDVAQRVEELFTTATRHKHEIDYTLRHWATPVERARVEVASVRGVRTLPLEEFLLGVKRNALEPDELVTAVRLTPSGGAQTFMKVGPRNAMVIAVCSLALVVDRERGEVRAAFGSAAPVVRVVRASLEDAEAFPEQVAAAASPIDDVRGTAAYRRHALRVLTARALERCLA